MNNNNYYEKVNLSNILNMTKLFRKIVIPVFCLICGFYVKQKLVNLYNLDVSLLIDYLLVYIPATISNSIISFILDNTKFLSYMMSSGNGDNASNIGEINADNVSGDNSNDVFHIIFSQQGLYYFKFISLHYSIFKSRISIAFIQY